MNPEPSRHGSPVAAISLLPEMTDDGQRPRDAIRVLVPGGGPGISVAYKSDGCPERNAFVRAPMVAVLPLGLACRIQCGLAGDTLVLEIGSSLFKQQVRATLGADGPPLKMPHVSIDPFIREVGNALRNELSLGHALAGAALEPLATPVAIRLARRYASPAVTAAPSVGLPQHKLKRVQDYVEHHLSESILVEQLAAEVHLSPYHFARMFKKATGQPPHLYVVMRRVEKAKTLLSDSETELSHLAAQIGFRTQGHFTGVFRRYTGYTPGAFRLDCRQSS
jgi:AraC family transcriptional regulator